MARQGSVKKFIVRSNSKEYTYWRARISLSAVSDDGKRQRDGRTFKTQREADKWLQDRLGETPRRAGEKDTVESWVEAWLDAKNFSPSVRQRNEGIFRLHVNPLFGRKRLDRVTEDDVDALLRSVRRKGLDENKVYMVARSAFTLAKKRRKISVNPFENVDTPSPRSGDKARRKTVLSEEQCVQLLTAIDGDTLSPLFTLLTVTGVRLGEALGLTWDRVKLTERKLEVRQELDWILDRYAYVDDKLHQDIVRAIP
jgi:integrase